jgi:UTP---glucose-1-phosphate uridylyltransferase
MESLPEENSFAFSYLSSHFLLDRFFHRLSEEEKRAVQKIISINQADRLFSDINDEQDYFFFKELVNKLVIIDKFYENIGGLIGYHQKFISLLKGENKKVDNFIFLEPYQVDITELTPEVAEYIKIGLSSLPQMAEIYPLGGAGDRLGLTDPETKEPVPQAKFNFLGKTLIEHLIDDLKAREYLYFKTYHEQLVTPIVIMTSDVKNNFRHVLEIFQDNHYFGRPVDSFFFIKQISVPVINEEGNWVMKGKLELNLKPGGHGALWSLMRNHNVFEWLKNKKRTKAIIRQINNPVAGIDYNLFAFAGYGIKENKIFGFASCPRRVGVAEGMNVLKKSRGEKGFGYNYSNIEYTDFQSLGIKDKVHEVGGEYSKFPSNTNTLFVDLEAAEFAARKDPFPGITINLKNSSMEEGRELKAGRLELLMQAIADNFVDYFEKEVSEKKYSSLSTFVTKNIRRKTITAVKNQYLEGSSIFSTPMGAYFDVYQNYFDLLSNYCHFALPSKQLMEEFAHFGPSFVCYLSPLLGPLFTEMGKKIRGGKIEKGSELRLDIADLYLENLSLSGSLQIYGASKDFKKAGKCFLKNIEVKNEGIDWRAPNVFYENKISRRGSLKIIIPENSIFEAEDVSFLDNQTIEVPSNHKIRAVLKGGRLFFERKKHK